MMGTVLAMSLSGVLCSRGFDDGWSSIFYTYGKAHSRTTQQDVIAYSQDLQWQHGGSTKRGSDLRGFQAPVPKTDVTPAILSRDKVAACNCACRTLRLCRIDKNWPISLVSVCLCDKVAVCDMHISCMLQLYRTIKLRDKIARQNRRRDIGLSDTQEKSGHPNWTHWTNKMQSEPADFDPGAATWRSQPNNVIWRPTITATWRTGRNIRVVFDSCLYSLNYLETRRHPHIALPSEDDRAKAAGNMSRKFCELWNLDVWLLTVASGQIDKQTNKQRDTQTCRPQYFATLP